MEELALYTGHPDVVAELVRFYRLRGKTAEMLVTAERFLDLTGRAEDPLLRAVVSSGFTEAHRYRRPSYSLGFIERVWRATKPVDRDLGVKLAKSYGNYGEAVRALEVWTDLLGGHSEDPEVIGRALSAAVAAKEFSRALEMADRFADTMEGQSAFAGAWARAVVATSDAEKARLLLQDPRFAIGALADNDPGTAIALLRRGGDPDAANKYVDRLVTVALRSGPSSELMDAGTEMERAGRGDEFEEMVRREYGDANGFLDEYRQRRRPR